MVSEISHGTFHSLRKTPAPCSPLPRHFLVSSDPLQFQFCMKEWITKTNKSRAKLCTGEELNSDTRQADRQAEASLRRATLAQSLLWAGASLAVLPSVFTSGLPPGPCRHLKKQKCASGGWLTVQVQQAQMVRTFCADPSGPFPAVHETAVHMTILNRILRESETSERVPHPRQMVRPSGHVSFCPGELGWESNAQALPHRSPARH